jgi:hypothetical protein
MEKEHQGRKSDCPQLFTLANGELTPGKEVWLPVTLYSSEFTTVCNLEWLKVGFGKSSIKMDFQMMFLSISVQLQILVCGVSPLKIGCSIVQGVSTTNICLFGMIFSLGLGRCQNQCLGLNPGSSY